MARFKKYFTWICIAFTLLTFSYAIMVRLTIFPEITSQSLLTMLVMVVIPVLLMSFTDRLPIKNTALAILIHLADIIIPVFALQDFPKMDLLTIVCILAVILFVYFGVFAYVTLLGKSDANRINKRLAQKSKDSQTDLNKNHAEK